MDVASQDATQFASELLEEGWDIEAEIPVLSAVGETCSNNSSC